MSRVYIDVDSSSFRRACDALSDKDLGKSIRSGMRSSLNTIKAALVSHVQGYPHRAGQRVWSRYGYTVYPPLWKDLRVSMFKKKIGGSVGLIGSRRREDRTYVLRFFNADHFGPRKSSAGSGQRRKGQGAAHNDAGFFERITQPATQRAAREMEQNIARSIQKRFNRDYTPIR